MKKKLFCMVMFVCVLGLVAQAEMVVTTADGNGADTFVGNDSNKGPNNNYGGGNDMDIRNYTNTRAHIGFVRFDISSIAGVDPTGAQLRLWITSAQNSRTWDIYAVNDNTAIDNWGEMTITYNNCPWMLPATSGNWDIDETKTTLLGTMFVSSDDYVAVTSAITSTDPNARPLEDLIKADTNNLITLVLIGPNDGGGTQFYARTKEGAAGSTADANDIPPTLILPIDADPFWASNPTPGMHEVVATSLSQLCWVNPEPNDVGGTITCDVYFGSTEPNSLLSDYGLATLATGTTDTCVSLPAALDAYTQYYWVVDVHDSTQPGITHYGRHWSFNTFNQTPSVDAGADQYLWLGHLGDPASATAAINATVTDDGLPDPVTYLWEQISGPTITISPNNVEDITQVFTEVGTYVLRLTADDGAETNSDTISIFVGADACEASQARPNYAGNAMDFNDDCFVDLTDLADFATEWLDCRSLDCP